jgi:hypothetical protein
VRHKFLQICGKRTVGFVGFKLFGEFLRERRVRSQGSGKALHRRRLAGVAPHPNDEIILSIHDFRPNDLEKVGLERRIPPYDDVLRLCPDISSTHRAFSFAQILDFAREEFSRGSILY